MVGAHFSGFGHYFVARYHALGLVLIAGGVAAAVLGLLGGDSDAIEATAGLVAAASLLAAGGWAVVEARSQSRPAP